MADLTTEFLGIKSPNPFWLASAPPTDKEYNKVVVVVVVVATHARSLSSRGARVAPPRGSWTSGSTSCDASSRRSRHFRSRRPPRRLVDRLARILGHCDPDGELQMEFE